MSIAKRKTATGLTAEYHYDFSQDGVRYRGVCEGCTSERTALTYEKKQKELIKELAAQKNASALVENFRQQLTGGAAIRLVDAYALYEAKPRPKRAADDRARQNQRIWEDFLAFMQSRYPDIEHLASVTRPHAEEYISELQTNGRFIKLKNFRNRRIQREITYHSDNRLTPTTANQYLKHCKSVFAWLMTDAGLLNNPFDLPLQKSTPEHREAFSMEELRLIGNNLNDFVRPIFIIGICSGLSEGDICMLKWSEIHDNWLTRKRRKTGALLDIPILPPLAEFLSRQFAISGHGEYVLPEHAAMYQSNPSGISYRFKSFLENLGIRTTKNIENRRAVSVKDVHSLRHTFAYMAGVYQIPLPVVQSVLGHMSPEMTRHYQAHADRQAKERYLLQLPNFLNTAIPQIANENSPKHELLRLIEQLNDRQLVQALQFCRQL